MEQVWLADGSCWEHSFLLVSLFAVFTIFREYHRLLWLRKDIRGLTQGWVSSLLLCHCHVAQGGLQNLSETPIFSSLVWEQDSSNLQAVGMQMADTQLEYCAEGIGNSQFILTVTIAVLYSAFCDQRKRDAHTLKSNFGGTCKFPQLAVSTES